MRQKFGDAVDGVIGYASEDVFKPGEGLDIHALTRSYEAAQHGRCPAADVATKKHPVAATQSPSRVHSAHIGHEVEVHYRWHPLYGRRFRVQHSEQRASGRV